MARDQGEKTQTPNGGTAWGSFFPQQPRVYSSQSAETLTQQQDQFWVHPGTPKLAWAALGRKPVCVCVFTVRLSHSDIGCVGFCLFVFCNK